ncbi:MAG: glycosyltransferase [Candidatus Thermoplasmatota archaeon]|nr:glycosyltransferase [Candidatus Thermoplasmatota archaeon]
MVVPARYASRTFGRSMESILQQTCRANEVIIVDDSRGNTVMNTARKYAKRSKTVRYIKEEFFSTGSLKNRGIMDSDADIILMTGTDCEVPHDWIERMIGPIKEGDDIVQGGISLSSKNFWSRILQRSEDRLRKRLSGGGSIDLIDSRNIAFRRDALIEAGMYDRHVRGLEDLHLKIRMKRYGFLVHDLGGVLVTQHRQVSLNDLFRENVEKGMWTVFIRSLEQGSGKNVKDAMFITLRSRDHLLFLPSLIITLFTGGPLGFISELISGIGFRTGSLAGAFRRERFLRSIQTKYY